ncbi:armadillo-type protein [Polychytrium aggregatum]|uniref:armadillo-type protein n=1 Tax=Polychytrium aggregatum TaxID=110093 RepID=UPI0022FF0594|nr:armadillo-type protein [Polychytrium aggregatum]KAI9208793.1 armadillo-type protein [Polychytrium aggregatum]
MTQDYPAPENPELDALEHADELVATGFASFFTEADEVIKTIEAVVRVTLHQPSEYKKVYPMMKWFTETLDKYQEQPHLLDPHLEQMVTMVIVQVRRHIIDSKPPYTEQDLMILNEPFRVLYYLGKVRGYKTVVKLFTHEVADLEPILDFLGVFVKSNNVNTFQTWHTRYVLLLWLSMLCRIPFDMKTVDSGHGGEISLVERMISTCKVFLKSAGTESYGAGILLGRLLTRRDTKAHLNDFVAWSVEKLKATESPFEINSIFNALCAIFKFGLREDLLHLLPELMDCSSIIDNPRIKSNTVSRKLFVKLFQRIGLCHLKPRVVSWRYQRGNRSLTKAFGAGATAQSQDPVAEAIDDDEGDCPEEIEAVIEILLNGLRDRDTIVRWSSAKGIGRITQRLPKELAQDVVQSVLDLFAEDTYALEGQPVDIADVSDSTWHGACLSLAELARRGLLLPEKLEQAMPWVFLALKFDQKKATYSVGAHVRDAACYVCWSFARAYTPEIMKTYMEEMAANLVVVSVFDREVNIRRAAAAAFQENVGRQGVFPHGLDIITLADYFSLSTRINSYLTVSTSIGQYEEYRYQMIDHLADFSLAHWDQSVRELASKALGAFTALDPDYIIKNCLAPLVSKAHQVDLHNSHGAILAVSEIALAYSKVRSISSDADWTEAEISQIVTPVIGITERYASTSLNTFGSDMIRIALCHLVENLAQARWPHTVPQSTSASDSALSAVESQFWSILDSSLERIEVPVQTAAATAVKHVSEWMACAAQEEWRTAILDKHLSQISVARGKEHVRRGYGLAIGQLGIRVVGEPAAFQRLVSALREALRIQEDKGLNDIEARNNALKSLTAVLLTVQSKFAAVVPPEFFEQVLDIYFLALEDYSVDNRGDVGSWVRQSSVEGLCALVYLLKGAGLQEQYLSQHRIKQILGAVIQQSVEKIDRVRDAAGNALIKLTAVLEEGAELGRILEGETIYWAYPEEVFPRMVRVLEMPDYRAHFIRGMVVSVGGLTESLVRHSSESLISFLSKCSGTTLDAFFVTLASTLESNFQVDHITTPTLEVLDICFSSQLMANWIANLLAAASGQEGDDPLAKAETVLHLSKKEITKCRDARKLAAALKVFTGYASLEGKDPAIVQLRRKGTKELVAYTTHPFPKIRRAAGESLYLIVCGYSDEDESLPLQEIEDILLGTDWDRPAAQLKDIKTKLISLLSL